MPKKEAALHRFGVWTCVALCCSTLACGGEGDGGDRLPGAVRVGLVFDIGGRGDKSFNDSAYRGLERAREALGIVFEYLEPSEGSDREMGLPSTQIVALSSSSASVSCSATISKRSRASFPT